MGCFPIFFIQCAAFPVARTDRITHSTAPHLPGTGNDSLAATVFTGATGNAPRSAFTRFDQNIPPAMNPGARNLSKAHTL